MFWRFKKCNNCEKLKDFLSYDGISKMKIHVVCYDDDIHHYKMFPRIGSFQRNSPGIGLLLSLLLLLSILTFIIPSIITEKIPLFCCVAGFLVLLVLYTCIIPWLGWRNIGFRLKYTGWLGLLLLLFVIFFGVLAIIKEGDVLWIVIDIVLIMASYPLLQLHFIDLKLIRVFEVALDNETYWSLKNMDLNNPSNRVHEIHAFPEKDEVRCSPFQMPIISQLVSYCWYIIRLVRHDNTIKRYLNHGWVSNKDKIPERIKQVTDTRMESVRRSVNKLNLKVLDMLII